MFASEEACKSGLAFLTTEGRSQSGVLAILKNYEAYSAFAFKWKKTFEVDDAKKIGSNFQLFDI